MPALNYGELVPLAANAHRITCRNPGAMTGAGTNTYLFGRKQIAVVDPGPLLDEHVQAILAGVAQLGGTLSHVFVTHTHGDHSPAAAPLAAATGAKTIGMLPPDTTFQDETFQPDVSCVHRQKFASDEYCLEAVHTPGHVGNHFCFFEHHSGLMLAGDHIMNGSTVVIVPPGGDMGAYIRSLRCLLDYPITAIAPAHGDLITDAAGEINYLVQHRLRREAKVLQVLRDHGPGSLAALVVPAYDDVDPSLHSIACYSLWAHLLKLQQDGLASEQGEQWQATG